MPWLNSIIFNLFIFVKWDPFGWYNLWGDVCLTLNFFDFNHSFFNSSSDVDLLNSSFLFYGFFHWNSFVFVCTITCVFFIHCPCLFFSYFVLFCFYFSKGKFGNCYSFHGEKCLFPVDSIKEEELETDVECKLVHGRIAGLCCKTLDIWIECKLLHG